MATATVVPNPLSPSPVAAFDGIEPAGSKAMEWQAGKASPTAAKSAGTCGALAGFTAVQKGLIVSAVVGTVLLGAAGATLGGLYAAGVLFTRPSSASSDPLAAAALSGALPNGVTYIALGDWGRAGIASQRAVVPAMSAWATALRNAGRLNFIMSVGDQVRAGLGRRNPTLECPLLTSRCL